MRKQFLSFLIEWLSQRPPLSFHEHHVYHATEVTKIPAGYYAVVTVELKRLPSDHPLVVETMTKTPEYA